MTTRVKEVARSGARRIWHGLDEAWCRAYVSALGDKPGLLSFLFHAVAPGHGSETMDRVVDPAQTLGEDEFRTFIEYFQRWGYRFVSPPEIRDGLDPRGRYVLMTFDDGYYNNLRILPVLQERQVPAVFFICSNYVDSGRAFWWDVVYRERIRQGAPPASIEREREALKSVDHLTIDGYLRSRFGDRALWPAGDDDRPMTRRELADFAAEPLVHIGNHTCDHAILTNYDREGIEQQIRCAQDMLASMTGERPFIISYPNGNWSPEVIEVAAASGLELGLLYDHERGVVPSDDVVARLSLSRLAFTRSSALERTYLGFRAGVSLRRLPRGPLLRRLRGR